MLKLKYLFENFDLAKEGIKNYEADEETLDEMLNHFRISSNAIYPFRKKNNGGVCFLRLSPVEEKSIQDVASEIRLIQWLINNGYPAMNPFPMKNGRQYDVIDTKWGRFNLSCLKQFREIH